MRYPVRTVVLVDPHLLSREGTLSLMRQDPSLRVIGECASGEHAIALCSQSTPDVVVIDAEVMNPPLAGTVAGLKCIPDPPAIVVLSTASEEQVMRTVFESGASAYIVRDSGYSRLTETIHSTAAGEVLIDAFIVEGLYSDRAPVMPDPSVLSAREFEVVALISSGLTTKGVSAALGLSPKTVETHRVNAYRKLGIQTPVELIKYALAFGLDRFSVKAPESH